MISSTMKRLRQSQALGVPPALRIRKTVVGKTVTLPDADTLKNATEKLGYAGPVKEVQPQKVVGYPLAESLDDMGCKVFTERSVAAYKAKVAKKANSKAQSYVRRGERFGRWRKKFRDGVQPTIVTIASMALLIAFGVVWSNPFIETGSGVLDGLQGLVFAAVLSAPVAWFLWHSYRLRSMTADQVDRYLYKLQLEANQHPFVTWEAVPLRGYADSLPIPKQVLQLALDVEKTVPKAQFFVHRLKDANCPNVRAAYVSGVTEKQSRDPFLEVRLGNESYYIAVWDEEGYRICTAKAGA
jgi:hypothetical protein